MTAMRSANRPKTGLLRWRKSSIISQTHLQEALEAAKQGQSSERQALTEGAQLRAARWLLDDRDAAGSLSLLTSLPSALGRRMVAMRMQLKAARLAGQPAQALDTAVLLAKHRAFFAPAAQSIVRGLAIELLNGAHEPDKLHKVWLSLDASERAMPDVAVHAAARLP